ncbi:hypothetical protein [Halorussus marinus]|uniref:hypothetical protein n=1 Tax=Halorussus marinus TaxID=2505976 RepID=UPI0010923659|nr:hypothetical protein [Halorussus marinus]
MAKSVGDIIEEAQGEGVSGTIRKILIAGPIATAGYSISYGIDSLQNVFTNPLDSLAEQTANLTESSLGGMAELLDAGSLSSANAIINEWGLLGWLMALLLIIATMWLLGTAYDLLDIDFLSGVDVPILSRFSGASDEE